MSPVSSCLSHSFDGHSILGCDRIFKVLEALRLASVSVIFPCRLHCFFAAVANAAEAAAKVVGKCSSHDSSPTTAASAIEDMKRKGKVAFNGRYIHSDTYTCSYA